ncbi:hypothetical protein VUR80DRAFT_7216 [Thermomyces stellatus]
MLAISSASDGAPGNVEDDTMEDDEGSRTGAGAFSVACLGAYGWASPEVEGQSTLIHDGQFDVTATLSRPASRTDTTKNPEPGKRKSAPRNLVLN